MNFTRALSKLALSGLQLCLLTFLSPQAKCHDGPDPWMRWRFDENNAFATDSAIDSREAKAILGKAGKIVGDFKRLTSENNRGLFLKGGKCGIEITPDFRSLQTPPPTQELTVSVWATVEERQKWGGLVSLLQDNGNYERGWALGFNERVFTLAVVGKEGPQRLTYLEGKTPYELGKPYHVVGVYDGRLMQLYVNGQLEAESQLQQGPILYPESAPLMVGAYKDANEFYGLRGRLFEASIFAAAAKAKWVQSEFRHRAQLATSPAKLHWDPLDFEIKPYLQNGQQDSMTVMWKTNRPAQGKIRFGPDATCEKELADTTAKTIHEHIIQDLKIGSQYFYQVECTDETGRIIRSEARPFQTAPAKETPFAFAVVGDTQGNPKISGLIAEMAWGQRPNFLLHAGDLVDTGTNDSHWTEEFFPSLSPLIQHVPFFPVLGNHEQNAKNYFDYVSLPAPEYYYTFNYGNTQFFMIDSNRNVDPSSEQFLWLDRQLSASKATWKFVCHHHPPYSSDENDYGNLWKTNKSTRGDLRVRKLVTLYEKHGVDFVWNGHIHSYERTWPVEKAKSSRPQRADLHDHWGWRRIAGNTRPEPAIFSKHCASWTPLLHGENQWSALGDSSIRHRKPPV